MKDVYVVSACLMGEYCRYDGKSNFCKEIVNFLDDQAREAIAVCPEQLGGLFTPREKSEIEAGKSGEDVLKAKARVISETGRDVTQAFLKGANEVLVKIGDKKIAGAILKAKSPSCGCGYIYDGSFSGKLVKGSGVTGALLMQNGVKVMTEEDFFDLDIQEEQE